MLSTSGRLGTFLAGITTAVIASLALVTSALAEGNAANGRILADTCKGCHAVDSYTNVYPTYHVPRIGGQSEEYLINALTLYKSGERKHVTMMAQAASYSEQDIRDIAAYIASVVPPLQAATAKGTAPDAAMVCKSCHGDTGVGQITSYPYLAGQRQDYLEQAMKQYKEGSRKGVNAVVMQAQLMPISDADLKAIAAYYAAQTGLAVLPK